MSAVSAPRIGRRTAERSRRPGVGTVYRWELRKLRAQKRTYLGLGAAMLVPLIFIVALLSSSGGPDEVAVRALRPRDRPGDPARRAAVQLDLAVSAHHRRSSRATSWPPRTTTAR